MKTTAVKEALKKCKGKVNHVSEVVSEIINFLSNWIGSKDGIFLYGRIENVQYSIRLSYVLLFDNAFKKKKEITNFYVCTYA